MQGDEDGSDILEQNGYYYAYGYGTGYLGGTVPMLLKLDPTNGNVVWAKVIRGEYGGLGRSIIPNLNNDGFIISFNDQFREESLPDSVISKLVVVELDANATVRWKKQYDSDKKEQMSHLMANNAHDGYVISGVYSKAKELEITNRDIPFLMNIKANGDFVDYHLLHNNPEYSPAYVS